MYHHRIRPPGGAKLALNGRSGISGAIGTLFVKALGSLTLAMRGLSQLSQTGHSYITTTPVTPVWSSAPIFAIQVGTTVTIPLDVTAPGYSISLAWVGPGTIGPGGTYPWITLNSGLSPSITFTNAPLATIGSVTINATAGIVTTPSPSGSVSVYAVSASPTFSFNPWRAITTDAAKNPFLNGAKHVMWAWHPVKKRVYTCGGDYSTGSASFATGGNDGQLNENAPFSTNASPQTGPYTMSGSLRNDQFSFDPYSTSPVQWRLEHQALPRNLSGAMEARPARPDQVSLIWDPAANKFWMIYTALRTEFFHPAPPAGPPFDPWADGTHITLQATDASGTLRTITEPAGTWSWIPSVAGPNGTWTLETSARTVVRSNFLTAFESGNVLVTSSASERIAYWERDPVSGRMIGVGDGKLFIFNPTTKTYEWRVLSVGGYSYFNMSSSMVVILDNYLYCYAYARASGTGTRYSYLVRINVSAMLSLPNGGSVTNFTLHLMPWSLSHKHMVNGIDGITYDDTYGIWEGQNQGFENWTEKNALFVVDGKIVCAGTYNGIVDAGAVGYPSGSVPATTRLHVFAPSTLQFYQCDTPPDTAIAASSWVTLPDSYEILMGLSTIGYGGTNLWAYRPTHIGPLRVESFSANEGYDPEPNMNGQVKWQTPYTLNDGGILYWGCGAHGTGDNNSVRKFWPSRPVNDRITHLYPSNYGTVDLKQYDNKNYFFIPAVNKLVIFGIGIFNLTTNQWDMGDLQPGWSSSFAVVGTRPTDYIFADASLPSSYYLPGGSYFVGAYNGFQAWSAEHDCGIVFSQGHDLQPMPDMYFIVKSSGLNNGVSQRYTVYRRDLPSGLYHTTPPSDGGALLLKARPRDGCCFMGDYVYWVGGQDNYNDSTQHGDDSPHFFRMDIRPHLTSKSAPIVVERLTNCPVSLSFGLLRPDKYLNALLLLCDSGIFAYDLTYGQWINLTSQTTYQANWGGLYGGYMPSSCQGDFVDKHTDGSGNTATYRRFYWRPGANGNWGYDTTNWAKFFSLKLTRS